MVFLKDKGCFYAIQSVFFTFCPFPVGFLFSNCEKKTMWGDDSPVAVASPASISGNGSSMGNGFYVGRGRGFGNISQMSNSLPEVGPQSNGGDDGWDDDDTTSIQPQSHSGWGNSVSSSKPNTQSGWKDDDWDESEAAPVSNDSNSWKQNNRDSYRSNDRDSYRSNDRDSYRSNDSRPPRKYQSSKPKQYSNTSHQPNSNKHRLDKGTKCFKCNEEGHMSRECPNGDRSGGGRSCFSCGDSSHISKDCPNKSGGGGGGRNCHRCNEPGHMARDCPNESRGGSRELTCYKCQGKGHMSKDCTNESSGGSRELTCYKCQGKGHMSKDCTNESSGGGRNSRGCYNCGEDGHMSKDCPNEKKEGSKSRDCFKCHQEGHMAKDCPNEAVGEDGKPRPPPYIPPEPSEDAESLFLGVPTGINFSKYDQIHVDVSGGSAPPPIDSFESSGLCNLLLKNIKSSNYSKPTPVQKYSIPIIRNKRDLMACAQTGSGKTAAFLLPILNFMIPNPDLPNSANQDVQEPWAVIVAPTRELVIQIGSEARKFAYDSVVKADVVYGGTSTSYQSSRIKRGCHILVATPGRLLDFLNKGKISFSQLHFLVLDEADRMLDMGFAPAIREMVSHESMPEKGVRQTLMFSATFPDAIQEMAKDFLDNYLFLTVGMVGAANTDVTQTFFNVGQFDKRQKLLDILKEVGTDRTLVFVEQKRTADFIASLCSQNSIPTTSIHGDRLQREREEALRDFRTGRMPVLVATAVAARGLDIRDVCHVINYDLPKSIDEYVHRIGRTGRVGNLGKATSFYDSAADQDLARSLKKILIDAQQPVPDWLSEEANSAVGTSVQYGGRGNFGARDVRNQGRGRKNDSNDAFDNFNSGSNSGNNFNSTSTFAEPVADEEDWG